ncbi:carboxypeptidase-like regulatory domain-containing protein [Cyclobacterium xiamenense]|uniref:carboxypeptidase-like regulatory domain-containing protein n=1 Tax=Cyclobacterium xiamenense TaxID=1297121 RepID=UPI0012B781EB|nr:carboxypeptidase-like regulatory domain-containing protein [Cyclobacterium xiamenense]
MKFKFLLGVLIAFLVVSCGNDTDPDDGPATAADIVGSVNLYDEGTNSLDNAGMQVSVEGTSPLITATTDANGRFVLADVPFGTHTLVYEKAGYGTFKKYEVVHENTGPVTAISETPSLGQRSTTEITALAVQLQAGEVTLQITTEPAGNTANRRYVRYFLGTESSLEVEDYQAFSPVFVAQINPFELTLSQSDLLDAGFASGQTVYVRAYGDSFWSNTYLDPDQDRTVFPNIHPNAAEPVSFVMP